MSTTAATSLTKLVEYDSIKRRLWIFGQRLHHGATGSLVAGLAFVGLLAEGPGQASRRDLSSMVAAAAAGCALMAHDWKDHALWFERGAGTQP